MAHTAWMHSGFDNYIFGNSSRDENVRDLGKKKSFIITQGISIIGYILFGFYLSRENLTTSCMLCHFSHLE